MPDGAPLGTTAIALLLAGGFAAGVVNSMAGGGSLLTVPLLVTLGLPGTTANATNRIAVLVQSIVGAWRFRAEGVPGERGATHALVPLLIGAAAGALLVSRLPHETFERLFGVVMIALLVPLLRARQIGAAPAVARPWPPALATLAFLAIGVYGGAIQAGVGILLLLVLVRAGHGLIEANSIKIVAVAAFTAVAVLVFLATAEVVWMPAIVLSLGTAAGADVGARLAVRGGERLVRPVLVAAVVALAGRMLGAY